MSRPCLVRLARIAGVKTMSEECYGVLRELLSKKLREILAVVLIANIHRGTRTIMPEDVYNALELLGENVARTTDLKNNRFVVKNIGET